MKKTKEKYYKNLFLLGAFYDWILGILFLFLYKPVFFFLDIPLPSDTAYLSLSSAFVFVLGFAYYFIYRNLAGSENLAILGTLYKLAYVLVGLYYFILGSIPHFIFLVFGFIDFIFAILFIEFILYLRKNKS